MLITDQVNKEQNHPLFIGQAIWSSVTLEIDNCPYFLVCSEIKEDGERFLQTSIVYGLRNLLALSRRVLTGNHEKIVQVALITLEEITQKTPWTMHNLREIWIDLTDVRNGRERYLTEDLREFYYSHYSPFTISSRAVKVFSMDNHK